MKTFTKILLVLLFSVSYIFSQSGWTVQNSGVTYNVNLLYFIDVNTGFAGYPDLVTTNGGQNWVLHSAWPGFQTASFPNYNTGYFAGAKDSIGNYYIYKTTNSGNNWVELGLHGINHVQFLNPDTGYVAGYPSSYFWNSLFKTTNGGVSWDSVVVYPDTVSFGFITNRDFTSIFFLNANTGYYSYNYVTSYYENGFSFIYKTTDGGNNWMEGFYSDSISFYDLQFPTPDTGYCMGIHGTFDWTVEQYYIFKCVNDVWTMNYSTFDTMNNIYFANASTGYAVFQFGEILKTTNGGLNWYNLNSGTAASLNNVYFLNPYTGYIAGNSGLILKTTNGGEQITYDTISGQVRFQDNNQNVTMGYVKAVMLDNVTNQIITLDSTGIQSNGSYSLQHVPKDSTYIMAFEDDEAPLQFVPTYYPSAINWQNATILYPSGNLNNINILVYRINGAGGPYHIGGYVYLNAQSPVIGLSGAILYAKIGNNFKSYSISSSTGSYQIDSLSAGSFFIMVDRMGYAPLKKIVNISDFSKDTINFIFNPSGIAKIGFDVPKNYSLSQNYPNPFNPATTIKFGIPKISLVKIVIYDILGREVTTIINEQFHAGNYSVSWDAGKYASGVYFYKIQAGDFVETKKLVVLK